MDQRADKSLEALRKKAEGLGVECRPESFRGSSVQAAISRGGRYLAEAFESAWKVDRCFGGGFQHVEVLYTIHVHL